MCGLPLVVSFAPVGRVSVEYSPSVLLPPLWVHQPLWCFQSFLFFLLAVVNKGERNVSA